VINARRAKPFARAGAASVVLALETRTSIR
jgi:hypothetical protein